MSILRTLQHRSWENGYRVSESLLEYSPSAKLLDVGCSDGERTTRWAKQIGTNDVVGIDAKDMNFPYKFVQGNLDEGLPFEDKLFDVVTAEEVIEHVNNTDLFIKEIRRVLKPGGYVMIGTPNLASGRVIVELLLNKQPNICHVSDHFIPRGDPGQEWKKSEGYLHRRTFTSEGLRRLLEFHGMKVEQIKKVGYGPFVFGVLLRGLYAGSLRARARRGGQ